MPKSKRPVGPTSLQETPQPFTAVPGTLQLNIIQQKPGTIVSYFRGTTHAEEKAATDPTASSHEVSNSTSSSTTTSSSSSSSSSESSSSPPTSQKQSVVEGKDSKNPSGSKKRKHAPKNLPTKPSARQVAEPSELATPRKLKRRAATRERTNPRHKTNVPLEDRLKQFPSEPLAIDNDSLFCEACNNRPLVNKLSTLKNHIQSASHKEGKVTFEARKLRQKQLGEYFKKLAMKENRNAPVNQQVRRFEVVSALLEAGVPLHKLNSKAFKAILENRYLWRHQALSRE